MYTLIARACTVEALARRSGFASRTSSHPWRSKRSAARARRCWRRAIARAPLVVALLMPNEARSSHEAPPRGGMRQRAVSGRSAPGAPSLATTRVSTGRLQPQETDFRKHVVDLFLTNAFSGRSTQALLLKAEAAGAAHVSDLAKAGARGAHPQNANRDLLRRLVRGSTTPSLYWAPVPLVNPKTNSVSGVDS